MRESNIRGDRKKEHIEHYLGSTYKNDTLFEDVYVEHNSLAELDLDDIDTSVDFLGRTIRYPIMINAMTGGTEFSREINRELSKIAGKYDIPMAVGSQTIALANEDSHSSFEIVREIMGDDGIVLSNLNGHATVKEVQYAMDIIEADGVQIHLNPAQELAMKEGDRQFKGILSNIGDIADGIEKPVIVKEVGFGISPDVARRLYDVGIRHIDISGKGGTNFIEIEDRRYGGSGFSDIYSWGIPTALSLIECRGIGKHLKLISSGGIRTSLDILKSLILGADMVGIGGMILRKLMEDGPEATDAYLGNLIYKLKMLMVLTGSRNIGELREVPYRLKGDLRDLVR